MEKPKKTPEQEIANSLSKLADNVEALLKGPLNRKALLILLAASSGLSKANVDKVLEALQKLRGNFIK